MSEQVIENVLQSLAAGLLVGAIYGLMCVGLALIFGVMRVINFAHGEFMMLGMYGAYFIFIGFTQSAVSHGYGAFLAAVLAGPLVFAIGYYVHRFLISRVTGTRTALIAGDAHNSQLTLTLGIALILHNGCQILFGTAPRSVRTPLSTKAWQIGPFSESPISVFINQSRGVAAAIAVAVVAGTALFFRLTRSGKAVRAAADNPDAAIYMGIDVDRCHRLTFGLGVGVTAVAGGLLATNYPFHPHVGLEFVIVMFAGVVLGGMGSVVGAFLGGMTIGLVQQMSTLVVPTQLQNTAIFVFFLLTIFFRPQGFFGRVVERT